MSAFLHKAGHQTRVAAVATAAGARSFWAGLMGQPDPSAPAPKAKRVTAPRAKKPAAKRITKK